MNQPGNKVVVSKTFSTPFATVNRSITENYLVVGSELTTVGEAGGQGRQRVGAVHDTDIWNSVGEYCSMHTIGHSRIFWYRANEDH